jgi:hypothetical protein
MLLDKQLEFSNAQDIGQVVATYLSTNVIDFGAVGSVVQGGTAPFDVGSGDHLYLDVRVNEAMDSAGAATLAIQFVGADNALLTTNAVVYYEMAATAYTTFIADYKPPLLHGQVLPHSAKRYFGFKYIIAGATSTAGTITARLVLNRQTNPTVL